uniref:Putative plasma membrane protein n=1 Tax=Anopheles aquasalis TaxID=42839 RepID=T1DP79_ANOAQ
MSMLHSVLLFILGLFTITLFRRFFTAWRVSSISLSSIDQLCFSQYINFITLSLIAKVLTWEFFLNRFDTLFVEAQVNLERVGDISYLRDLRNSENGSEVLSTKINKAREALSQSDTSGNMAKTLSASFGTKWPYKRTMSAPATIIPRQESKNRKRKKLYNRQVSAPILKRKSSRFGLEGHIHSINGPNDDFQMGSLYRVIDLEEADKETIHLLVFLLMQFLSRPDLVSKSIIYNYPAIGSLICL